MYTNTERFIHADILTFCNSKQVW